MEILSFLPLAILYVVLSIASIPHFIKGDYVEYIHTALWFALTIAGAIMLPVIIYN